MFFDVKQKQKDRAGKALGWLTGGLVCGQWSALLLTLLTPSSQSLGGTAREQPPASNPSRFLSHVPQPQSKTTTFPHQNTFSPFINTRLVKLTKVNVMDGFLKGNYVVRYLSILKRGLLKAFSLKAR